MTALSSKQISDLNKASRANQNATLGTRIADLEAANSGSDMFATAGTVSASKAVVVDANKRNDTIVVADGGLKLGAAGGTAVTSTAAELNLLDGSVAGTSIGSKALALGANRNVDYIVIADGGLRLGAADGTSVTSTAAELNILTGVTSTAAELNILDGVTASAAELNLIDGSSAGTAVASKALVLGANKNVDTLAVAASGLKIGAGAGTAVSTTAAELCYCWCCDRIENCCGGCCKEFRHSIRCSPWFWCCWY
jgi:hypothetical protein